MGNQPDERAARERAEDARDELRNMNREQNQRIAELEERAARAEARARELEKLLREWLFRIDGNKRASTNPHAVTIVMPLQAGLEAASRAALAPAGGKTDA